MSLPPIHYGDASTGYELRFEGNLSLERTEPCYVFQMDTAPCFPTFWRVHPRRGTPDQRRATEKRLKKLVTDAPNEEAIITKRKDGYWLTTNSPSSNNDAVEAVSLSQIKFLEWLKSRSLKLGGKDFTPLALLEAQSGAKSCLLETLSLTPDDKAKCQEFMLSDPGWWPLAEALKAYNVMALDQCGAMWAQVWLRKVIIAEINRGTSPKKIIGMVPPEMFSDSKKPLFKGLKENINDIVSPVLRAEILTLIIQSRQRPYGK